MKVIDANRVPKGARKQTKTFKYVTFYDPDSSSWVCGTTQYNIISQGRTMKESVEHLAACLHLIAVLHEEDGRQPFENREPATEDFHTNGALLAEEVGEEADEDERYTGEVTVQWWTKNTRPKKPVRGQQPYGLDTSDPRKKRR